MGREEGGGFRLAAAAKSLQSCPSLCDPIDGSPPGSPVPGILQARSKQSVITPQYAVKTISPLRVCVSWPSLSPRVGLTVLFLPWPL